MLVDMNPKKVIIQYHSLVTHLPNLLYHLSSSVHSIQYTNASSDTVVAADANVAACTAFLANGFEAMEHIGTSFVITNIHLLWVPPSVSSKF